MILIDLVFNKMLENLNFIDLNIMEQALKDAIVTSDLKIEKIANNHLKNM